MLGKIRLLAVLGEISLLDIVDLLGETTFLELVGMSEITEGSVHCSDAMVGVVVVEVVVVVADVEED